jgi:hypothetical protein
MFRERASWPEQRVNARGPPIIPLCGKTSTARLACCLPLCTRSGMIAATKSRPQRMRHLYRETCMKRALSSVIASVLAVAAGAAFAQGKPPLKLGAILDMSGL